MSLFSLLFLMLVERICSNLPLISIQVISELMQHIGQQYKEPIIIFPITINSFGPTSNESYVRFNIDRNSLCHELGQI